MALEQSSVDQLWSAEKKKQSIEKKKLNLWEKIQDQLTAKVEQAQTNVTLETVSELSQLEQETLTSLAAQDKTLDQLKATIDQTRPTIEKSSILENSINKKPHTHPEHLATGHDTQKATIEYAQSQRIASANSVIDTINAMSQASNWSLV